MVTRLFPVIVCATVALSGCAGRPDIPITSDQLHRLKAEEEIRILSNPSMVIDHLIISVSGSGRYQKTSDVHDNYFPLEDPLAAVQNQFAAALLRKLDLHNLRTIHRDELPSLDEQSLGRGVVLKFDTRFWQIYQGFYNYAPKPGTTLPTYYILKYVVEGRLFRDGEANLLWKASCKVVLSFEASVDILLQKLIADENSIIHLKRREAETRCTEQLLEKFFFE